MKRYEYIINKQLYDLARQAIRDKRDILQLLSYTVKSIIEQEIEKESGHSIRPDEDRKLIVYIDKMNRLFYCIEDKYFSFQNPYSFTVDEEGKLEINYKGILEINSYISSIMISIFKDKDIFCGSIDEVYDRIDSVIINNYESNDDDKDKIMEMIIDLMIFEPGYIRFDDDNEPGRVDPVMHPRYHYDVNYESTSTYKIGLSNCISSEELINLLDINKPCKFICSKG